MNVNAAPFVPYGGSATTIPSFYGDYPAFRPPSNLGPLGALGGAMVGGCYYPLGMTREQVYVAPAPHHYWTPLEEKLERPDDRAFFENLAACRTLCQPEPLKHHENEGIFVQQLERLCAEKQGRRRR